MTTPSEEKSESEVAGDYPSADAVAWCEDCFLPYAITADGSPVTERSYTCDDCGGYVDEPSMVDSEDLYTNAVSQYGVEHVHRLVKEVVDV